MHNTNPKQFSTEISKAEYNLLLSKFPSTPEASFQAGSGDYYVAEWTAGKESPNRLVHYFQPILG